MKKKLFFIILMIVFNQTAQAADELVADFKEESIPVINEVIRQLRESRDDGDLWEVDGTEHQLKTADEIDMQTKKIINVVDPASDQDAATKKYVDDNDVDGLWEVDGTEHQLVTADEIDMQSKKIINVTDPTSNQDAATKKYADDLTAHQADVGVSTAGTVSTTSSTYSDLDGMSVTLTTGANPVLVMFSGTFFHSAAGTYGEIILDVDGTDNSATHRQWRGSTNSYQTTMSLCWLETMTADSHTWKIQWKTGGATFYCDNNERVLVVVELKMN